MIKYNQIITERMIQATGEVSMAQGKISPKLAGNIRIHKITDTGKRLSACGAWYMRGCASQSTSSVHSHLETLEKNGYIRRDPTKPRAIEILDESLTSPQEMVNVPMVGRVAGEPLLAEQNVENYFLIPWNSCLLTRHLCCVKGDSAWLM